MTKYEPKHEWVKEMGLTKSSAQIADSLTDHVGNVLDHADLKDYAFMTSWIMLTVILVKTGTTKKLIDAVGASQAYFHGSFNPLEWGFGWNIIQYVRDILWPPVEEKPKEGELLSQEQANKLMEIGLSLVFSYFILTQGGSIISAISAIGGKLV